MGCSCRCISSDPPHLVESRVCSLLHQLRDGICFACRHRLLAALSQRLQLHHQGLLGLGGLFSAEQRRRRRGTVNDGHMRQLVGCGKPTPPACYLPAAAWLSNYPSIQALLSCSAAH